MKNAILFFLLTFPCFINAQISEYNLSHYSRPELRRYVKQIGGNFSLANDYQKIENQDARHDYGSGLSGSLFRSHFLNDSTKQQSGFYNIRPNLNFSKLSGSYKNDFFTSLSIQYNHDVKRFTDLENNFKEMELDIFTNLSNTTRTRISTDEKENDADIFFSIDLGLYLGKGRIEFVNDAWHAASILEILQFHSLIETSEISDKDVTEFAYEISKIKNTRNTDFRLEYIAEIERLVKYLKGNEEASLDDVRFYAHLIDAWQYESFATRRSGVEFKYGITAGFFASELNLNFASEELLIANPSMGINIQYNRYNPISLDWQFDNLNSIYSRPSHSFSTAGNVNFNKATNLMTGAASQWNVSYLPNQRTNYSLGTSFNFEYIKTLKSQQSNFDQDATNANLNLSGSFKYYISPQLVWNLSANMNFDLRKYGESTFINDSFSNQNSISFNTTYFFY